MDNIVPPPRKRAGIAADPAEEDPPRVLDPLVNFVMEEEQARKRAKKGPGPKYDSDSDSDTGRKGRKGDKGQTLEQVEEMEGGTIKESKIGMAAAKRVDRRKQKASRDETEMLAVNDLLDVEEALEQEEDEGVKLEPFNLAQEREEGHFDEGGSYVENKEEDDPTMRDAWLTSEDAGVLSEAVRRRVAEQQARMARAEEAPQITPRQAADLMRDVIGLLQPRETVTRALRRLRPHPPPKQRGKKKDAQEPLKAETEQQRQAKAVFEKLTETASTLMDAGELDIYSTLREDLEARADKYPAEKDEFDMFGDEDAASAPGQEGPVTPGNISAAQERQNGLASTSAPTSVAAQAAQVEEVDYSAWPVKELARFLKERGHDPAGLVEKADLVAKVKEVAEQGPEGEQPRAPPGYVWDPSSNLFYSSESGMYFSPESGYFYSSGDGKWYAYDEASKSFVEVPPAQQ